MSPRLQGYDDDDDTLEEEVDRPAIVDLRGEVERA
jgi:hypothetical protein